MEVSLKEALPAEAHELSQFRQKVWDTTYRGIYPDEIIDDFDYGFHDKRNLLWINSEEFSVYFILAGGEKAGYLIMQEKETPYVQSLYLLESFRGKGIGKKVFGFIKDYCRV